MVHTAAAMTRLEEWYAECERDSVSDLPWPRRTPMSPAEKREYSERLACLATPTDADLAWLTAALRDNRRRWFVADVANRAPTLAEALFEPMLDVATNEVNPSHNKWWVRPCVRAFGARRVMTYLLDVLQTGSDFRKAGAANAWYHAWAGVHSDEAHADLADVRERSRVLLLETFVANPNIDVRRSTVRLLTFDPGNYPAASRPLVARAIAIARAHPDRFIRQCVAHLDPATAGRIRLFSPLPHRKLE